MIDDREQFANKQRFPMAAGIYTDFEESFAKLKPNPSTYLLIVTRGHRDDMHVPSWAVKTNARYIGMIGSKRKVLSVYQALGREGYAPELFDRVNAPVGLAIGALTPEEIAVSITAELVAVRRGAANLIIRLSTASTLHKLSKPRRPLARPFRTDSVRRKSAAWRRATIRNARKGCGSDGRSRDSCTLSPITLRRPEIDTCGIPLTDADRVRI